MTIYSVSDAYKTAIRARTRTDRVTGTLMLTNGTVLDPVSYTHLRAHETDSYLVCRLLLEKKKNTNKKKNKKQKRKIEKNRNKQ